MTDTQQLPVGAQTRPRPGRLTAAQLLVWLQTPIALLIGVQEFQDGAPVVGALFLAAAGVMVWGGVHIGRDRALLPSPHESGDLRQVPWDWSDVLIFLAAVFVTAGFFEGLLVPLADAISPADATVRRAVESLFAQGGFYGGAIFDIWLLAGLRRGANLYDIGWRRFQWWWLPAAVLIGGLTVYGAGLIEQYMSQLFPQAQNGQCQLVRHEFGHYLAIAIVVVCVMAPLAEETIFRGFIYGWARRAMPLAPAV
ncbi:MAG: hypothetical protein JOZ92_06740, partial [Candidatus Dormibacteraeota bacterium]|nr:hypothetical protein [Candidatus Dormibacteraeota bacterium]